MQALSIRTTRKYVGTYAHLDTWEDIGSFERISKGIVRDVDETDPCEPFTRQDLVKVAPEPGVTESQIRSALEDSNSRHGCAHEYDCCGCWSYHCEAKPLAEGYWLLTISGSRNY